MKSESFSRGKPVVVSTLENLEKKLAQQGTELALISAGRNEARAALAQSIQELHELCAQYEALQLVLGMDQPWPLQDVLAKLMEATDHLLTDHDCDLHGHEEFRHAIIVGKKYLAGLYGWGLNRAGSARQPIVGVTSCACGRMLQAWGPLCVKVVCADDSAHTKDGCTPAVCSEKSAPAPQSFPS